ncbi:MAG: HAD hydrolase family protein [Planctomycetota bacterium]|nr:HAD hydrolase family protein [Planctomycetota bacterium]
MAGALIPPPRPPRGPAPAVDAAFLRRIRLFLFDVDGCLTDGGITLDPDGREIKTFDARDGHGIRMLARAGVVPGFLTGRASAAVQARAKDLSVPHVITGAKRKLEPWMELLAGLGIAPGECAYMGDDLVDIPILRRCGFACCPADARDEVRAVCHYVAGRPGGKGAAREAIEVFLRLRGQWEELLERYYE